MEAIEWVLRNFGLLSAVVLGGGLVFVVYFFLSDDFSQPRDKDDQPDE